MSEIFQGQILRNEPVFPEGGPCVSVLWFPTRKKLGYFWLLSCVRENQDAAGCYPGSVCQQGLAEIMWSSSVPVRRGLRFRKVRNDGAKHFPKNALWRVLKTWSNFIHLLVLGCRAKAAYRELRTLPRIQNRRPVSGRPHPQPCGHLRKCWGRAGGRVGADAHVLVLPFCGEHFFAPSSLLQILAHVQSGPGIFREELLF